jgi:hypothetical protein
VGVARVKVQSLGFDQNSGNHFPSFTCQNIVSAACSSRVHGFNPNAMPYQGLYPLWLCKTKLMATAKDDQFGTKAYQSVKVTGFQVLK